MDPQQRLVMGASLDCLHDASVDFDDLVGSATGVFIGLLRITICTTETLLGQPPPQPHDL